MSISMTREEGGATAGELQAAVRIKRETSQRTERE
jgi:hypothetical protein